MPVSTMTFLYGLSILTGALTVAYALRRQAPNKELSADSQDHIFPAGAVVPTGDVLPLKFTGEPEPSENQLNVVSEWEPHPSHTALPAKTSVLSKTSATLIKVLKAPLGSWGRTGSGKKGYQGIEDPLPTGTLLCPKTAKGSPESTDEATEE